MGLGLHDEPERGVPSAGEASAPELVALYHFTDRLFRSTSEAETYQAALDAIVEALGTPRAAILRFDRSGAMRFVAWRGLSETYRLAVDGHSPWRPGQRDAAPLVVADVAEDRDHEALRPIASAERVRALAFFPVTIAGAVVGKFMAYYEAPHAFTAQEIGIALTLARQLGFALERHAAEARELHDRELFEAVFERVPVMIKVYEPGLDRLHLNAAFVRMLGWTEAEGAAQAVMAELLPDPDARARFEAFLAAGDGGWLDVELRTRTGEVLQTSWAGVRLSDGTRVAIGVDVSERQAAIERQRLVLREMDHRVRNLFTLAGGVVRLSARESSSIEELVRDVQDRLEGLARAHALTVDGEKAAAPGEGSGLLDLVRAILEPYDTPARGDRRLQVGGEDVVLCAEAVTSLALLFYELATNAAKYGGLSNPDGQVMVRVRRHADQVEVSWSERGGPPVDEASRGEGFGATLAQAAIHRLGGLYEAQWLREGLHVRLNFPSTRLTGAPESHAQAGAG